MDRTAESVLAGLPVTAVNRLGLWRVNAASRDGSRLWFRTGWHLFLADSGLLYSRTGPPAPGTDRATYRHADGGWYRWFSDD